MSPPQKEQSDEALMAAYARDTDRSAFDEIFRRYSGIVMAIMRRGYRSTEDARDLVQQTFLQVHRARADFREGQPLKPWLLTIARNVLRDRIRYERRRPPGLPLEEGFGGHMTRPEDGAEHQVARNEDLKHALATLPRGLQDLLQARFFAQESYESIAARLSISKAAAKVRVHRAVAALRRVMTESG